MILKTLYNVYTAADSQTALRMLQEEITFCDLIITDIVRPGMNGIEMVKEIRKNNVDIPIIIISGNHKKGINLLKEGLISACIPKPYNFSEMVNLVKQALDENLGSMGSNILFVDDDEDTRMIVDEILTDEGCKITTAKDGSDGLEKIRQTRTPYDLIITGIYMPVSGEEMISVIRQTDKNTPIVVISGGGYEVGCKLVKKGLVSACLPKPFTNSDLLNVVQRVLSNALADC